MSRQPITAFASNFRLNTGFTASEAISYRGEHDSYQTTFIDGLTYSVRVGGRSSGAGTLADPNLTLTDSAGNKLLFNDDISPTNLDAQLTFTVNRAGTYYLIVGEQGDNDTGSYTISISAGYASAGNDRVVGTDFADAINGMAGNDTIYGGLGNDRLFGGAGADVLFGERGADRLEGNAGADILRGGQGADVLIGGLGADRLMGGQGADRFVFNSAAESAPGSVDRIVAGDGAIAFEGVGVAGGDVIDLRGIDANALRGGQQSFQWSTAHTAGSIHLENDAQGNTLVVAYTDNDGKPDFVLVIEDGAINANQYSAGDFLL
ncbi:calcium-binding protein [Paracoccus aminophilus]|uniref:Hemolysin-type calcium-binding region n=1 Tax=Paracoccus aminophilus JCM 7686 TaxID=1367847 RepID=S5YZ20_PARAH|nr:calcium-binding protein [Paracoccus aminophilus]AGT10456.1 hemolysin-type calcium-binding region [Paracoccus aminophilus JCM 7686]